MQGTPSKRGEMSQRLLELQSVLSEVRRRWTQRAVLRAWALAAVVAAVILFAGLAAVWIVAREGFPLVVTLAFVIASACLVIARALWPFRARPSDRQVARFIEEQSNGLDDVLVTAVDYAARPESSPAIGEWVAADALDASRRLEMDDIISPASIRQRLLQAAAATGALVVVMALLSPSIERATGFAAAYLFPARVAVDVSPGAAKVRAGQPVTITARVRGVNGFVPTLTVALGQQSRDVRMQPANEAALYCFTIENVTTPFAYHVAVAGTRSPDYTISVVRPPRVQRIDVRYEFPRGLGLEPRTDEDSGDIYGPEGTIAHLTVTTDKPIANAALAMSTGEQIALHAQGQALEGQLKIDDDGSYRVALADIDGLEDTGDTEYFIRTLEDRPPDVRILRPAGDKQVTPLEEVEIEARADDDYGIASLELVFQSPGGKEKVVPFGKLRSGLTASG